MSKQSVNNTSQYQVEIVLRNTFNQVVCGRRKKIYPFHLDKNLMSYLQEISKFSCNPLIDLLNEMGFIVIARGRGKNQHDIVFVRKDIAGKLTLQFLLYASFLISIIRKFFGKLISAPIFLSLLNMTPRGFIRVED